MGDYEWQGDLESDLPSHTQSLSLDNDKEQVKTKKITPRKLNLSHDQLLYSDPEV